MNADFNAANVLKRNFLRTDMLIEAMERIGAYNRLYQDAQSHDLEDYRTVKAIQDSQLSEIEQACSEHAIISLATVTEVYMRALVIELFARRPEHFLSKSSRHSSDLRKVISSGESVNIEDIEAALKLHGRREYYEFFDSYGIPALTQSDKDFVDYLHIRRNNLVHAPGFETTVLRERMLDAPKPFHENSVRTEAKRLRTKVKKMLYESYERVSMAFA